MNVFGPGPHAGSIVRDLFRELSSAARFAPAQPYQRLGYACGALLILSGVVHVFVYLVDGGAWHGPLSWRKPIVFGLSFGITVVTLTWFLTFLRLRRVTGWALAGVLGTASVAEVFLISLQKWRGVESHFNENTAFDETVFTLMGQVIALVALVTVVMTVRSFFRQDAPPSLAWAIRTGLVLMIVGQAVGVQMVAARSNTYGAAGALKVPHAVTLHAVQVLPALALLLVLVDVSERRRVRIVALAALGYLALITASMLQTYAGRGPLDPSLTSSIAVLVGLALLAASALVTLRGVAARWRQPAAAEQVPVSGGDT
jgi:hypothetical protein